MCGLWHTADSLAEMPDVHCGIFSLVDGSRRNDADCHELATDAGDFVCFLGGFAACPMHGYAGASGNFHRKAAGISLHQHTCA
jgi:hypothetical protein